MEKRLVREPECRAITGLSRATRWRLERDGKFPKKIEILPGIVGWEYTELIKWVEARISDRDSEMEAAHARAAY